MSLVQDGGQVIYRKNGGRTGVCSNSFVQVATREALSKSPNF